MLYSFIPTKRTYQPCLTSFQLIFTLIPREFLYSIIAKMPSLDSDAIAQFYEPRTAPSKILTNQIALAKESEKFERKKSSRHSVKQMFFHRERALLLWWQRRRFSTRALFLKRHRQLSRWMTRDNNLLRLDEPFFPMRATTSFAAYKRYAWDIFGSFIFLRWSRLLPALQRATPLRDCLMCFALLFSRFIGTYKYRDFVTWIIFSLKQCRDEKYLTEVLFVKSCNVTV